MRLLRAFGVGISLFLAISASSTVSPTRASVQRGRLRIGDVRTETVSQIMARHSNLALRGIDAEGLKESEEPELSLKSAEGSPPSPRYDLNHGMPMAGGLTDPPIAFGSSFLGVDLNLEVSKSGGFFCPPDTMGAVGPDQFLLMVNGRVRVFDKQGHLGPLDIDTNSFWAPTGVVSGGYATDSRVLFDPTSGRWFVLMINISTPNDILLAYSSGSHISSSTTFAFVHWQQDFGQTNVDSGHFADFPTLGADGSALYIGCNMLANSRFYGTTGFVLPKPLLFAGVPVVTAFRGLISPTGSGPYSPQGAANFASGSQGTGYFVGVDALQLGLVDILRIGNPGTLPFAEGLAQVKVPLDTNVAYNPMPPGSGGNPIDGGDFRLCGANICRNALNGCTYLLCAHSIATDSSGNARPATYTQRSAQWFEFDLTSLALDQSGILFDSGGNSLLDPTLTMSETGQLVIGFTKVGPNLRPQCVVARQVPGDASGTFPVAAACAGSDTNYDVQTGKQRWGDYSMISLDPSDGLSIWTIQEFDDFDEFGLGGSWACQVSQVMAPPPPPISKISPALVASGYGGQLDVEGTPTALGQCFYEPSADLARFRRNIAIRFGGKDLLGGATPAVRSATDLGMKLSGSQTAVGNYPVAVTNPDGQVASGQTLHVVPALAGFSVDSSDYSSGSNVLATLTLASPATEPEPISLVANSGGGAIKLPGSVTIAAGQSALRFYIATNAVPSWTSVEVTAADPGAVHALHVTFGVSAATLKALNLAVYSIVGGFNTFGEVYLTSPAGPNGAAIKMVSSDAAHATVPSTVTIPAGHVAAYFSIVTKPVSQSEALTISATYGSVTQSKSLTLLP